MQVLKHNMNNNENVENQEIVRENHQTSNELLFQILQETQLKLDAMDKRMSEMAVQMGQHHEEMQETPRAETEVSEHNRNPSPKQTDKQKKKEIVADLSADIKKIKPTKFSGTDSGEEAEAWLTEMEQYFEIRNFSETSKAVWGIYQFTGEAATWWGNTKVELNIKSTDITWEKFVNIFRTRWLPQTFYDQKLMEFQNLKQGELSVHKYREKLTRLLKYVPPYQQDTNLKVRKFIMGLNNKIGGAVDVLAPRNMEEALEKAVRQEHKVKKDDSIRDNKRKTNWNSEGVESGPPRKQFKDFKNNKPENRSSGTRDNQGNSHINKNEKNNEKRGPPGGCFICEGNHFKRQCPNLNQQQRSLPQQQQVFQQRIHAALDNRQAEQQLGPIETPGKIYGKPCDYSY